MSTRIALVLLLIGYALITAGGLFKIMHWPGANIQLLLGACVQVMALLALAMQVLRHDSLRALLDK